jgi:hypothetical protein
MTDISSDVQSAVTPFFARGTETQDDASFLKGSVINKGHVHDSLTELNDIKLHALVTLALGTMQLRGLPSPLIMSPPTSKPDLYSNARFEKIAKV